MTTKYTLNLNKVDFNLPEKHLNKANYVALWNSQEVQNHVNHNPDNLPRFLLHDGPPYANGDLHLGHFANKSLKDCLLKFKRLNGYFSPFMPGFDCHGLPLSLAVEKEGVPQEFSRKFTDACYSYAANQVLNQTSQFKEAGVLANFDKSYRTNEFSREATEMQAVLNLANKGLLFQKYRPVHWCKDCQSSLAESEVEYVTKTSDSLTVKFKVVGDDNTFLLVWTTTPYTLPANQGVAFNAAKVYGKFKAPSGEFLVKVVSAEDETSELTFESSYSLENLRVVSPYSNKEVPVVHADYVQSSGTGLVHLAPSFGLDDFHVGETYNLDTLSYVSNQGEFDTPLFPELTGLSLPAVSSVVKDTLLSQGLVHTLDKMSHEYPTCWRHKTPLFFKASKEWFMELSNTSVKATESVSLTKFYPEGSGSRLASMLKSRSSWCVSRNRAWGVPLPRDLSPDSLSEYLELTQAVATSGLGAVVDRGLQTLDVWFDSGVTHTSVLFPEFGTYQADLYLEGHDQVRGWFQSSLLTGVALNNQAPFKAVFSHGFVVDDKGRKLSKSLGNYVSLSDLYSKFSPDVLRLWVLSQDVHKDLTFSDANMSQSLDKYKKFRNTMRFCLQNLQDYDNNSTPNAFDQVDLYALHLTYELKRRVLTLAESFSFNQVVTELFSFCDEVSSVYFDSKKDTLYCYSPVDPRRQSCQRVLFELLHTLTVLVAPLLPYSAEDSYSSLRSLNLVTKSSVLLDSFRPEAPTLALDLTSFEKVLGMSRELNKLFEKEREAGFLKKNNERVVEVLEQLSPTQLTVLRALLGNQHVQCVESVVVNPLKYRLKPHSLVKCPRCWNFFNQLQSDVCSECNLAEAYFSQR